MRAHVLQLHRGRPVRRALGLEDVFESSGVRFARNPCPSSSARARVRGVVPCCETVSSVGQVKTACGPSEDRVGGRTEWKEMSILLLRCVYGGSIYKHSGAVQQHGHLQHSRTISRALRAMFCRFLFWPTPSVLSLCRSDPRRFTVPAPPREPCAALYSETRYLASRETRLYTLF